VTGQSRKDVVVGLGNILLSDEGIGVHIVRRLAEVKERYPQVDFLDAGTAGMNLLHLIANRKKAIIIDCAKMGAKPGTINRFGPDEVESIKKLAHYSLHEVDILKVIDLSKQLGECPEKIVFFGIEPESLKPGQTLSKTLAGKIDSYITEICKELS
jgi:hydrogenase maturation protease